MKNKSFIVGFFVIISLIIATAAVLVLGAKDAFTHKSRYVMFFKGDMTGLGPGAPVVFRGVKIGEVTNIKLIVDKNLNPTVPVMVEINPKEEDPQRVEQTKKRVQEFLQKGLCAQLATESFVTGKLMIKLEFAKDKEKYTQKYDGPETVIPTVASDLDQIKQSLANIPIKKIMDSIVNTLDGINNKINSKELTETLNAMNSSMKNLELLLKHSDKEVVRIGMKTDKTLDNANKLMNNISASVTDVTKSFNSSVEKFNKLSTTLDKQAEAIGNNVQKTTKTADRAINELKELLKQYKAIMDPDSPIYAGLVDAISNFNEASNSITDFTEYLNRHPESLIRGKQGN